MILEQNLVPHDIPPYLNKMVDMYEDLFSGGKGYRGALVLSVASDLGVKEEYAQMLSNCIEYIHNASLLHDDFVDGAELRRGKTTAWKKYGGGYAILGGDYLLAKVIKNLCVTSSVELIEYTSSAILNLVEGEWLQDACHGRVDVTKSEMERVHKFKTSALFSWCFKAPALLSEHKNNPETLEKLHKLGDLLGALLQRSDDLLDYDIRNFEKKAFFKDLPSGYFNLFTICLLEHIEPAKRKEAFSISSIEELQGHFEIDLQKVLREFDQESEEILSSATNLIEDLEFLSSDFRTSLKEAAYQIYWRKSV